MHKIAEREFTLEDFSTDHLTVNSLKILESTIIALNYNRHVYINGFKGVPGDNLRDVIPKDKKYWWQMIQLLPSSYNQRRTVMLNYEVLANIYKYRKNHKLDEWIELCKWIESLPYSELITGPDLKDIPMCNKIMQEAETRVKCEPLANGPDMTGSVKE